MLPSARAQSDALVVGTQWADLLGAQQANEWPIASLPISSGSLRYNGTPAQRSQVTRSDGEGGLLFFAVDGNIYDAEGYLIADALAPGCQECVDPGIMEMLAVPVPGSCGVFFILSSTTAVQAGDANTHVAVSVLDMNADNPYWSGRSGGMLNFYNGEMVNAFPAFGDWELELVLANATPPSDYSVWLPEPQNFTVKMHSPMLRVIDPDGDGDLFWLYIVLKDQVLPYRIDDTGIKLVNTGSGSVIFTYPTPQPWGQKSYSRDADVALDGTGNVLLAMSDCNLAVYDPATGQATGSYQLLTLRFNAATGAFMNATGHAFDGNGGMPNMICLTIPSPPAADIIPGLNGLALLDNASKVLFTGERVNATNTGWEPTMGIYDLVTQTWSDLIVPLNISGPVAFVRSRALRNRVPGSTDMAVYFPFPEGSGNTGNVAALLHAEDPGNMQWVPSLAAYGLSASHQFVPQAGSGSGFYRPIFLNTQITRDEYAGNALSTFTGYCCVYLQLQDAVPGYVVPETILWNSVQNPFGNVGEVTFSSDLVVPSGVLLEVSGMTLRFGPNAKLVVERNAEFRGVNALLTAVECADTHWPGIRVEGTTSDAVQTGAGHGTVNLNSCTVEFAVTGIYGGRQIGWPMDPQYCGGYVVVRNSTFKDCVTGVHFENYRRWSPFFSVELDNLNRISGTAFITTADWRGPFTPGRGARLFGVNGVRFENCSFVNQVPEWFTFTQRGMGIQSRRAGFICGQLEPPTGSLFENLHVGVYSSQYLPDVRYRLVDNTFVNNFKGVLDQGGRDAIIINNDFTTMDAPPGTISQASIGIQLHQSERYAVEKNTFSGLGTAVPSSGIWFTGPSRGDNRIYDNDFTDLTFGCTVEGRHLAENLPYTIAPGLQMLCGYHENNAVDQLIIGNTGYIKYLQGVASPGAGTANNTFNSTVDCSMSGTGPSYHPLVITLGNYPLQVRYHVYQHAASPEMRPDCIEDINGDPISFIGDWFYDLVDVNAPQLFDREEHCNLHIHAGMAPAPGSINTLTIAYADKQAELASAFAQYKGAVDQMRTPDLLGMIDHQPWHPSYLLRDTLMGNHPLSDSVMKAMIYRLEPMDQWHLTQVLLQNSPLSPWVWAYLNDSEALSPYFHALLHQSQQGTGLRQMLEEEVSLRGQESTRLKHELLMAWAADSTTSGRTAAFEAIYLADSLGDGVRDLYMHHLEHAPANAADQETQLMAQGEADLVTWGQLHTALDGDWGQLDSLQTNTLFDLALDPNSTAAALAWASLLEAGVWDSLPSPEAPAMQKSLWQPRNRNQIMYAEDLIRVIPNPASDRMALVFPPSIENGYFELFDGQGRLVSTLPINGQSGFLESSVKDLAPGLYVVRLVADGRSIGTVRFTVAR